MAFAIHNLNKTLLESKFKMRCKVGHLGQWIEFHSLRRNPNNAANTNATSQTRDE